MNIKSPSLPEINRTIAIPNAKNWWKKLLAYAGPGYLVAVGYIDPGNWATDIAAGSKFGYSLLGVIFLANCLAVLLQALCVRLAVATEKDLAQACRDNFHPVINIALWLLCELAILACDLAELLGSAIALKLLFGCPMLLGICITGADVLILLLFKGRGFRHVESLIILLITIVGGCFAAMLFFSHPDPSKVIQGFLPDHSIWQNSQMLYLAIGIMGATIMPHNLYLHSSIIQSRNWQPTNKKRWEAIKFGTIDATIALSFALFINCAILIVSAATFHASGHQDLAEIEQAYRLLSPLLGVKVASFLFALALLASGQSSTLTATLAGQIVMEGFLDLKIAPWLRRLLTRCLALIPALIVVFLFGEKAVGSLLILSQVILSLQLPFAVVPLVIFTSNRRMMGEFVCPLWLQILSWAASIIIIFLNLHLLYQMIFH